METEGRETEGTRTCTGGRSTLTLGSVTGGLTGSGGDVGGAGAGAWLTGGTVGGGVGTGELVVGGGGAAGGAATGSEAAGLVALTGVFGALAVGLVDTGVPGGVLRTSLWLGRWSGAVGRALALRLMSCRGAFAAGVPCRVVR